MNVIKSLKNLNTFDRCLWALSVTVVVISYFLGSRDGLMSLAASVTGVSALIFVAKGDVLGQVMTVIFSVLYGLVSWTFRYYGEMITYLCMTAPSAVMAVISWLRHQHGDGGEVEVGHMKKLELHFMLILTAAVTFVFYFILKFFNTANLAISTVSIATSFSASYLVFRRNRFYAVAYGLNDIVLIIMWIMASFKNPKYLPMVLCFTMFLINDMYGFISWSKMKKRQEKA